MSEQDPDEMVGIPVDEPSEEGDPVAPEEDLTDSGTLQWDLNSRAVHALGRGPNQALSCRAFTYNFTRISWTHKPGAKPFTTVKPTHETPDMIGWKWTQAYRYQMCIEFGGQYFRLTQAAGRISLPIGQPHPQFVWVGPNDTLTGYGDNGGGYRLSFSHIE